MENDATSENVVETLIEVEAKEGILHTRLEALLPVIEWLAAIIEVFAIIVLGCVSKVVEILRRRSPSVLICA